MTVDLYRNEGHDCTRCHGRDGTSYGNARLPPRSNRASSPPGSNDRRSSAGAVSGRRSETDCLLGSLACRPSPLLGVGGARAIGRGDYGRGGVEGASSSLSTRERDRKAAGSGSKSTRNRNGQERRDGGRRRVSSGKEFLLRYHHHVTFRRLAQPVMDTHTVQMPLSLSATCLEACGAMVAVGTREGPVILFHVGPVESPPAAAEPPPPRHGENPRDSSGSSRVHSGSVSGGVGSSDSSGIEDRATVVRAYGSLSKGEGPISAIVMDRAKIVAAGRGSGKMDGLFVVRIYAVDSSRLLRSLRCIEVVSRLCLFDPVLAVHCWPSGNLLFRDIYADSEGMLGPWDLVRRWFAPGAKIVPGGFLNRINTAAFAPVEVQQPVMGGDGVLLHCTSSSGYMYEMLMSGAVRNFERVSASPEGGGGGAEVTRGWHVCADSEAKLVNSTMMARAEFRHRCRLLVTVKIRVTPRGNVSGWYLHQDGRRARGPIFSFGTDVSSADIPTGICRSRYVKSVTLAAGGMILATARHGAAPCLWDVRLTRQRKTKRMPVELEPPATGVPAGGSASSAGVEVNRGWTWRLALYDAERVSIDVVTAVAQGDGAERAPAGEGHERDEKKRPRCVKVKPWPARACAQGLIVDAGRGRMVSAGSDGRLRITRLRPNNREQRLRTALLLRRRPCKTGPVS